MKPKKAKAKKPPTYTHKIMTSGAITITEDMLKGLHISKVWVSEPGHVHMMPPEMQKKIVETDDVKTLVLAIKKCEMKAGRNIFLIGEALNRIQELGRKKWQEFFGSHVEDWGDVVREIGYSYSTANNLMKIYRVFYPLVEGNEEYFTIPYTKLARLLPLMYEGIEAEKAEGYLDTALKLHSEREVTKYVKDLQGKGEKYCEHKNVVMMYKCTDCHSWIPDKRGK